MMMMKIVAVFAMGAAVGVMYRIPRSLLVYGAFNATLGWLVAGLLTAAGTNAVAAVFFGSVALGAAAEALARRLRKPATIFIIPGFIPLVPGREAYTTMRYLVEGRYGPAVEMATLTLLTAGAIAFGIFVSVTLYRLALNNVVRKGTDQC
ncbi:threonine/serine exporter family protein [Anaeroselena agilis]|uniref:Threonine/serine exporter family protein n=1 Tax=Anaeroselena agilis TaxID=3063788 RepID=A0ABU3P3S3_9FIRM|nr:threonine/serine exporter family protein [Selenomonadales bacterium 4137-cl]